MTEPILLESEKYFLDPTTNTKKPFPEPFDESDIQLSLVVPAYKEQDRLPVMMKAALEYLYERQKKKPFLWEIVIVDDGSSDNTYNVALQFSKSEGTDRVRVLKLEKNRGKGGAVKRGMHVARGRHMLMCDADGATPLNDIEGLEAAIEEKDLRGVAVGSRAHLEDDVIQQRSFFRNFLMWGFHLLVLFLGGIRGIKDTQCGFKLFSRKAAHQLFSNLHVERWCFDVELLYLASVFSIPVVEVAVNFTDVDGSKLDPIASSIQMFKDLLRIRLYYMLGIWKSKKVE